MTERYDGSTIDLEQALVRYMVEQRLSRRDLLERIARVGAAAALAPVIAACTGGAGEPRRRPSLPRHPAEHRPRPARRRPPAPTPVPEPEAELFIYNWTDYIGEDDDPVVRGEVRRQGHVRLLREHRGGVRQARRATAAATTCRSRSRSTSRRSSAKNALLPLDKSLLPNIVQPRRGVGEPGLRPGQRALRPVHVVDDRRRLRLDARSPTARRAARRSGTRATSKHISMLDDYQEVFAMALIQLGYSANTTDTAQMDEALALLQQQKPLVRVYSTDTIGTMSSGDVWIGQIWGADTYAIQAENENVALLHARGGRRSRARTRSPSSRARSTRSPRTCSSTTCSTPR